MGLLGRAAEDIPEAVEQGLPEVPGDLTGQEQTKNPSVPRSLVASMHFVLAKAR